MATVQCLMIDLFVEEKQLTDPDQFSKFIQTLEEILQPMFVSKRYETKFGESNFVIFSNEQGSLTCTLKSYSFGLATFTIEESLTNEKSFTNAKAEELRKEISQKLKVKGQRIPLLKRGSRVPLYFSTGDDRCLEYNFDKVVYEASSPYQNIKILHSPTLGNVLLLDDMQNLGDCDINYTRGVMKHGVISYKDKDVLILGGGDGGLLHEILKEEPKFVTMVDIDEMVLEACKVHLRACCGDALDKREGHNYKIIVDDCLKMMDEYKKQGRTFDIIINDLTDIPIATSPQGELWDFVRTILNKSFAILRDDGSYLNHAISDACTEALRQYEAVLDSLPFKVTYKSHMAFVPSFMENWVFYEVKKA